MTANEMASQGLESVSSSTVRGEPRANAASRRRPCTPPRSGGAPNARANPARRGGAPGAGGSRGPLDYSGSHRYLSRDDNRSHSRRQRVKRPCPRGDQELQLLRHIARTGPCTVGEAADAVGAQHGLARSTVLTVMERLRGKGYLTRGKDGGVYRYASVSEDAELVHGVVGSFVE